MNMREQEEIDRVENDGEFDDDWAEGARRSRLFDKDVFVIAIVNWKQGWKQDWKHRTPCETKHVTKVYVNRFFPARHSNSTFMHGREGASASCRALTF